MSLEIGSKVNVKDGSYMATQLSDGTISHSSELIPVIGWNKDCWTILLVNIGLPTMHSYGIVSYQNNMLIKNDRNNELWFCSKINIKEVEDEQ